MDSDGAVPDGYEHCPICNIIVHGDDLINHIRHGGCRLYKARERMLIQNEAIQAPCPICAKLVHREGLRTHLELAHPEKPSKKTKLYRYTTG